MGAELVINAASHETRIALIENNTIAELYIERSREKGIVGNIYKGRVTRVLPGMQAAFVDIGLEKAAFLYVDDVFVHPEIWEAEEVDTSEPGEPPRRVTPIVTEIGAEAPAGEGVQAVGGESGATSGGS